MTRYFPLLETCIVLRTTIFGAGVLAGAGTAAGVDMQIAEAAA